MSAHQPVTGRYQLLDGPFTHLSGSTAAAQPADARVVRHLAQGRRHRDGPRRRRRCTTTTSARTTTPSTRGIRSRTRVATRYYFSAQRSGTAPLSSTTTRCRRPAGVDDADRVAWSPVGNPCGRPTDQWAAGVPSLAFGYVRAGDAVRRRRRPPRRSSVSTARRTRPRRCRRAQTIAGPIDVTVYATANRPRRRSGSPGARTSRRTARRSPLTEGALLGSLRARDAGTGRGAARTGRCCCRTTPYTKRVARAGRRRAADPLRHRGVPDLRDDRGGAPDPDHAVDRGHPAPRADRARRWRSCSAASTTSAISPSQGVRRVELPLDPAGSQCVAAMR